MGRRMGILLVVLGALAGAAAVSFGVFLTWALADWDPDDPGQAGLADFRQLVGARPGEPGPELRVLTWNVAFGGGAGKQPTETHTKGEVLANLADLARVATAERPDVVFLQEVDRPSHRSGDVDQLPVLQDTLGLPYACFVTTWRVRYLPFPPWPPARHIGRVWSGQVVLSRFPIAACQRVGLPQPPENPWWYNRFFLHRAVQVATLDVPGRGRLNAVNVHTEAFSQVSREEHARRIAALVRGLPADEPLVLAGDFNTVPADAPLMKAYPDEPETDFTTDQTLATVRAVEGLREVFLDDRPGDPKEQLTFPAEAPNRRLDYVFSRGLGPSLTRRVLPEAKASDHRPIVATFGWR